MSEENMKPPVITIVRPLTETLHVQTIDATPTDMLMPDCFVPIFFAYRLQDSTELTYRKSVDRVKAGLTKVLILFFPWAGRWIEVPPGRDEPHISRQLECNDKGVPFIEAYVDKALDDVVRISTGFQPVLELQGYRALGMDETVFQQNMIHPEGLPSAFVQVTRFNCGGLVVAVTFNHMLADGKSFIHFMRAWSDISRTNETDIICDHNRAAALLPRPLDTSAPYTYSPPFQWEARSYEVSASVIATLKREARTSAEGASVRTMDCIFAHMWKTLSGVSSSPAVGGRSFAMMNSVEGRTRFYDVPLSNLLGNVVVSMREPSIPIAELLEMKLSLIAKKVREKRITMNWLSPRRATEALSAFTTYQVLPWGVTSWTSFPVYKIDFGFGNPFFSPGFNNFFSWEMFGMSYVGPPTPGVSSSAAFMVIRSNRLLLEALEDHPDFLPFFLPDDREEPAAHATI